MKTNPESLKKTLASSFDDVIRQLPEALATEGFGVLTKIDVKETLAKKLGVDFRRYEIFGACNPRFAHQALQAELEAGVMLPCNVIVYEDDDRHAVVRAVDPANTVLATGNPTLEALAAEVRTALARVVARLE
jgi:uncharacterized protein (DUF302 family)